MGPLAVIPEVFTKEEEEEEEEEEEKHQLDGEYGGLRQGIESQKWTLLL
jgi:hypothetical protein